MGDDSDSEVASRKRKLEDDDVRSPRGSSGLGRLQSSGGNAMRDKVHKLLTDALSSGENSNRQRIRSIAEEVEASLYDSCKGVNEQYKKKAQTLKFNLSTNEELREQVVERSILASNLVNMSTADLARQDLKKRRVTAAEESLKEIVNNEEVQKMKQAAEGLSMRKTDQGLVVAQLQEKEREDEARRKDEEEKAFKRKKEEEEVKKKKEKETLVTAGLDMGQDDEKSYLSTFTWKQVADDDDAERNSELDEPDSMPVSSPTLEGQSDLYEPQISVPTLDDDEAREGLRMEGVDWPEGGGHLVWHGTLCPATGRKDAFDLDASLVDGQGVHDMMPSDLSVKGTLPLKAVVDYLESKMKDKSKVRSVYKLTPHHEQQHDSKAHELYRHFTESLRKHQRAGVLIDSKQMLLYAVPPGNSLASSLVNDEDAQTCLIAVALTSRRKAVQRSVEEITADVSADFRTALGSNEKMVKLMASVIGKVKTSDCHLRASLVAGENRLDKVPRELGIRGRAGLDQVIEYLLQQQVMVVDLEPEGEEDSATYLQISDLLQEKKRAAVVLDTSTALMYLIPPVDEAGKLMDPPQATCMNMLGVLLINQQAAQGNSADADEAQVSSEQQSASREHGNTSPAPADTQSHSAAQSTAAIPDVAIPQPNTNGSAAVPVPNNVGAAPDLGPTMGGAAVGGARENRPAPVVMPQPVLGGGGLAGDVAPSPRPLYTPTAMAADSWKQQQPMEATANQPPQPAGQWNQGNAPGPNAGRGYMQHSAVHPQQQQHHQAPPPHPYQQNNPSRPPPPQHPPPPNHMGMNHLQPYPVDPARGNPHYPPGPGMPGNGGMGMRGVPGNGGMGMPAAPGGGMGQPGMQHGPGGMMGHEGNMFGAQGRGYNPVGGGGNAYNRGPPQGYHHNY